MTLLAIALSAATSGLAHGAEGEAPRWRGIDVAKAKAREAEKQRLIAKLHAEVPKQPESQAGGNPLSAPIFHRHDRP
ncbi:MAG TPA: hypothetical protein VII31_02100 [Caldimonas sp.]